MTKNSLATRTITCNGGKGKLNLSIFIDSDSDDLFQSSVCSSQGFTHFYCSWGLNTDSDNVVATPVKYKDCFSTYVSTTKRNTTYEYLIEMHNNLDILDITTAQVPDLITKLSAMSEQVDSWRDLLLSSHFKIDSVKNVIKETGVDVARIRLNLY
ncbi:hypothetical protein EJD97_020413 [Solanum chilense]|uniref:Uncharacterized protein n=1 Tax=Solanum chilense TaxID=4083 RepID=A0A6N2B560_SOLCI|nr:hypothetical protein EJD97_020413 [Solanum chilense]